MWPRFTTWILWLSLVGAVPAAGPRAAVLHLINDGTVPGELIASDDPAVLRWRSPQFVQPLDFPLNAVKAVYFPPAPAPQPFGEYCFELLDGDILYGDLLSLSESELEVNSALVGNARLTRANVRRLYRWKGAETVYHGPNGLAGWSGQNAAPRWTDQVGRLYSDQRGATLFGDLGIPEKAAIEIELSWKKKPDFTLALGVDERDRTAKNAFRFEVWDDDLVLVGETAKFADAAGIRRLGPGEGRVRVLLYLDQKARRLILVSGGGSPLATLNLDEANPPFRTGVRLTNGKGDLLLEHIRVTRWSGTPPRDVREDQARVHRNDGSIVYGQLSAYDSQSKEFTIRDGGTDTVLKHDSVADVFLSASRSDGMGPDPSRTVCLAYPDGTRLCGKPTRIEEGRITLVSPAVKEPMRLSLAGARSVISLQRPGDPAVSIGGRAGRLEIEDLVLPGRLVERTDARGLVWKPDLSRSSSPLIPGFSGRVVYREPPPQPNPKPPPAQPRAAARPVPADQGMWNPFRKREAPSAPPSPTSGERRSLHLRTGDTIPCDVARIDEKGVTFKSPQSTATFVPHEKIKSVELVATRTAPDLDESKRERLLTLPRMQRDSPPTHMICSKNGDFLRGRIIEMDDARLTVEVRLETKQIPRDRVAQIIWLHADELAAANAAVEPVQPAKETRAQAVNAEGNRLTFVVEASDGTTISGTSDVLGACRVNVADVDQLLFGALIEQSAARLAYHVWKLRHATEPKFVQDDTGTRIDGASTGIESALVGQPAPAFQLDLLDGGKFQLADRKGRIVVLDFWATWCGPCIQYMPQVDRVVREFADKGVDLIAVNMEEQIDSIKSMLERHKLTMHVALDRDGAVAAKYAVTAIPQTVVIDRDGKVARLYVGGGKTTAEALRKALEELSTAKPPP